MAVPMAEAVPTALNKEAWRTALMAEVLTASATVAPTPLFEALLSLTPPRVETLRLRRMGVWYQALVR